MHTHTLMQMAAPQRTDDELLQLVNSQDMDALRELLRRTRQEAEQRAQQAEQRERLLLARIDFQDRVIAMRNTNEHTFHRTMDNLYARLRRTDAEVTALRCGLLTAACTCMAQRPPTACGTAHMASHAFVRP